MNTDEDGRPENRLARQQSPYLLQHAHNPVDWYPWGDEAFEAATRDDKPVFLSIGYSTCHWCHVMERESFEDGEVAALLNEHYVAIKVDREERPDLDAVYMAVCQAMTGSGGWPLTVLLTPDKRPFFAGTYFPKSSRLGRPGLMDILEKVRHIWKDRREEVERSSDRAASVVAELATPAGGTELDAGVLDLTGRRLAARFDGTDGGFGRAPKFPTPHNLGLLLRHWKRSGEDASLRMVTTTLDAMRRGGIFDHVGLGFHRYSTDSRWLVPHFEKMLYDQALLTMAYVEAFLATGQGSYGATAREVAEYVSRDLSSPEGAFFSAEDADSEGEEGKFYVWTTEEVRSVVGAEDYDLVAHAFGLRDEGNFAEESTGELSGLNILHLPRPLAATAEKLGVAEEELVRRLGRAREALFERRAGRVRPSLDDKVLTDWNGMMIAALARAGAALDEPAFVHRAARAAEFLERALVDDEGRLLHRYRDGSAAVRAFLDDYSMLAWGMLELYEATAEARWLGRALELTDESIRLFWDDEGGGFFQTAHDAELVITRPRDSYDGASPAGNSVAAHNLVRLARLTGRADLEERAGALFSTFSAQVARAPDGHTYLVQAFDLAQGPTHEVVVAGRAGSDDTAAFLRALRTSFLPSAVHILRPAEEETPEVAALAPFVQDMAPDSEGAVAYVCTGHACDLPVRSVEEMIEALG